MSVIARLEYKLAYYDSAVHRFNHYTTRTPPWQAKAWTAIDRLSVIWKSELTDKMKCSFFQAAAMSILLYGWSTWALTIRMEKKLDSNYTRMLRAILNKSWRQHPTKQQLYGHLPPIMKTIQIKWTRHAGHWWRIRDEFISDILLWTPSHGWAKAWQPARIYRLQLCAYIVGSLEEILGVMDVRDRWWERFREIHAGGVTWWWWLGKGIHTFPKGISLLHWIE